MKFKSLCTFQPKRPVKNNISIKILNKNCFLNEYGVVYIGQTGHTTEIRYKKHAQQVSQKQPDKSVVAEHNTEAVQLVNFTETKGQQLFH